MPRSTFFGCVLLGQHVFASAAVPLVWGVVALIASSGGAFSQRFSEESNDGDAWQELRLPSGELSAGEDAARVDDAAPAGDSKLRSAGSPDVGPTDAEDASVPAAKDKDRVRFNFRGADWQEVLEWLADIAAMNLDWQKLPEGELNLATQHEYTLDGAFDVLNMQLMTRGFTLLKHGEVLRLVELEDLSPALVPRVSPDELHARSPHEFVRVSFALDWLVADQLARELQPMLSPYGKLMPMAATNRLEAIDAVLVLREIDALLAREQSPKGEGRLLEEFPLVHVRAEEIIGKLRDLLGVESTRGVDADDRMRFQLERTKATARLVDNLDDLQKLHSMEQQVHLVVNEQRNSVLANAPPDKMAIIRAAIERLDVPAEDSRGPGEAITRMKVYQLNSVDPDSLVDWLNELRAMGKLDPSLRAESDDDSYTLLVYATPEDHLAIANLLRDIEQEPRKARVLPLQNLQAEYAAQSVRLLMQGSESDSGRDWRRRWRGRDQQSDALRIEADGSRNRLLAWANDSEWRTILGLLAELGENAGGMLLEPGVARIPLASSSAGPVLQRLHEVWPTVRRNRLHVEMENTEWVARQVRRALNASDNSARRIRIVPPQGQDAALENWTATEASRHEQDGERREPAARGERASRQPDTWETARRETSTAFTSRLQDDSDGEADEVEPGRTAAPESPRDAPPSSSASANEALQRLAPQDDVHITVHGEELLIHSEDERAVMDAVAVIDELVRQLQPESTWTVFYLQAAEATQVAAVLAELVPGASVVATSTDPWTSLIGSWAGGSFGSSSLSGVGASEAVRIVPDERTNSLFVSGREADVRTIEQFVRLLDTANLPGSLRDRVPRVIQVEYANAEAIAGMIRELYKDYMEDPRQRQRDDRGRRGGRRSEPRRAVRGTDEGIRLTLAVDTQTNRLIVSADNALFQEIEALVREQDEAARSARPTSRVVRLSPAESLVVQQALTSLSPRIQVSVTSSATSAFTAPTPQRAAPITPSAVRPGRPGRSDSAERRGDDRRERGGGGERRSGEYRRSGRR